LRNDAFSYFRDAATKWREPCAFSARVHVHSHAVIGTVPRLRAMCMPRDESSRIKNERTRRGEKASMEQREKPTACHGLEEEIAERYNNARTMQWRTPDRGWDVFFFPFFFPFFSLLSSPAVMRDSAAHTANLS